MEELKENCRIVTNDGREYICNYLTNYPVGEGTDACVLMTRLLTVDNKRMDIKFKDVSYILYTTTIEEMYQARISNAEVDGFYCPEDEDCLLDEDGIPPYVSTTTDGSHVVGYI